MRTETIFVCRLCRSANIGSEVNCDYCDGTSYCDDCRGYNGMNYCYDCHEHTVPDEIPAPPKEGE